MKKSRKQSRRKKTNYLGLFFGTLVLCCGVGIVTIFVMKAMQDGEFSFTEFQMAQGTQSGEADASTIAEGELIWESGAFEETAAETAATETVEENYEVQVNENGKITLVPAPEQESVQLLFAGDVLFDDSYSPMAMLRRRAGGITECFSAETFDVMKSADVFMINNEFTYTSRGTPTEGKTFTFRSKPENVGLLEEMGVDIVSLANNHAYDYGEISMLDTLDTLNAAQMPYVGAGHDVAEAEESVIFQFGDVKIGYLSATQIERMSNPDTKGATPTSAGVFRCLDSAALINRVKELETEADFTVVYVHWGTESTTELDYRQTQQAQELVDAGADLIIGDHPHILQRIDVIDHVPVIYSLGNYWFNSSTLNSCLVEATVTDGALTAFRFIPARQSHCYTEVLSGQDYVNVLNQMRTLSTGITIDDEGYVNIN